MLVSAVFFKKKTISFPKAHLFIFKKNLTFENFESSYSFSLVLQQFWCFRQIVFKKVFVSKKPIFLTPNFRTFWTFLLIQSHSTANLLNAAFLERIFFSDNASDLFSTKTWIMNSLRNFTNSVAFYRKFTTFNNFSKNQIFFPKNTFILFNKTKFWTFWEVLRFQSHFTANLLLLAISKKFKNSLEKPIFFSFKQKPNVERFEKSY